MKTAILKPTRAEIVRQRRSQHQRSVVTRLHRQKETPKPQKMVRRYQAAVMAVSYTQPRAVSLPRLRLGWRLLSGSLILLIGLAIYLLWTLPFFRLSDARIQGNQRIPAEEIEAALALKGVPVFLVAPEILEDSLLRFFPDLEAASVKVGLPARITITLRERQPVIAWIENGAMTWVDAEGFAFRPRGEMPNLVIVMASGRPAFLQPDARSRFLPADLVRALQSMTPYVPSGTPILYDPQYGLGWNDPRGWRAYFGLDTDNLVLKLHLHETLTNTLLQRGIRPSLVSVAYPNALLYRLEP